MSAYRFFRHLINGLRMLRGSAQDLFLPGLDDDEYLHLARRMGYPLYRAQPRPEAPPRFRSPQRRSAGVRGAIFRPRNASRPPKVTVADIVLSAAVPVDLAQAALAEKGFANPARAILNLRQIAGEADRRPLFARLATLATDVLAQRPDPDMALNNWERFLRSLPDPAAHLRQMLSQPMRLEILLSIFSASQFLADTLVRDPDLLTYIGRRDVLNVPRGAAEICAELSRISADNRDRAGWVDALRRYRRREILRIGARDICLGAPTQRIMEELSDLADGVIQAALARIRREAAEKTGAGTEILQSLPSESWAPGS